jgi:ABC-type uncharacterized transport system substrate-binding protein
MGFQLFPVSEAMMHKPTHLIPILLLTALTLVVVAPRVEATEVVIVGDTQLKLVAEVVAGIRKTLRSSMSIYSPTEVKGTLRRIVKKEQPRIVIALGREALGEAQELPGDLPVIYGFVLTPPVTDRPNTTGIYMAAPVREYADLVNRHLHSIKNVAVIGSRDQLRILDGNALPRWSTYSANSSVELINTLKQLNSMDAILLLPNATLLTPATLEEAYLLSFRRGIPLLGISERQVRDGALLALVADLTGMGRQIGEYASTVLGGTGIEHLPPAPARRFELYLNRETARKMAIPIPESLLKAAKRVYP